MKKTNKKLKFGSETLRVLSVIELQNAAGGVPPGSQLGSNCLTCNSLNATCYSCFPCVTAFGATCQPVC